MKLNPKGFSHHLLMPLLVIALISFLGVRILTATHADTPTTSTESATASAGSATASVASSEAYCFNSTYSLNSSGTCVSNIQAMVNYYNTRTSPASAAVTVNGTYGSSTKTAITYFQEHDITGYAKSKFTSLGVVNASTWKAFCTPLKSVGTGTSAFLSAMQNACATTVPYGSTTNVHVDGSKLINGKGKTIRLLGVDADSTESSCVDSQYPGFAWGGEELNATDAEAIASWKINAVRVPLNEDCWLDINGSQTAYSGAAYQTAIKNWVTALNNAGIVAILDLHWSAPGSQLAYSQAAMADENHSVTFWSQVATTFKANHDVIFDLYNEPYLGESYATTSTSPWTCWLNGCTVKDSGLDPAATYTTAGMQQLVNTVRNTGATQPIELGGLNFSSDPCGLYDKYDSTAACPETANMPTDPLHQLIISYHNYLNDNTCTNQSCWDTHWSDELSPITSAGYPMVTDEFGEDDCADTFMNYYMDWADTNNESYLAWAWIPTQETCSTGSVENWYLIDGFSGTANSSPPQGANFKAHLAEVSPY